MCLKLKAEHLDDPSKAFYDGRQDDLTITTQFDMNLLALLEHKHPTGEQRLERYFFQHATQYLRDDQYLCCIELCLRERAIYLQLEVNKLDRGTAWAGPIRWAEWHW